MLRDAKIVYLGIPIKICENSYETNSSYVSYAVGCRPVRTACWCSCKDLIAPMSIHSLVGVHAEWNTTQQYGNIVIIGIYQLRELRLYFISSFFWSISRDVTIFCFQSKILGETCSMTTVTKSSEVHQEAELTCRRPTGYETSKEFASYGFTQIGVLVLMQMARYVLLGLFVFT